MDLGVLLESPQGSQSSTRVGACTCAFLPSCSSSVALPFAWIKGSGAFPRGFPTRLSHRAVHVSRWCESILGLKVEAVQGKQVSWNGLRHPGDSGNGAREEGFFPCVVGKVFLAFPSHLKSRRSPQERREKLQGRDTFPSVPQISQSIPGKPVFPALP